MVIWLVGLSGSGKTTIGKEIYKLWKAIAPNTVMIDGDEMRDLLVADGEPNDFSMEGRYKLALQYSRICAWLDKQDINVICCTISNFKDIYKQNRVQLSEYFQVFLNANIELLLQRDPKGIYSRAAKGLEKNVVGVDLPFTPPKGSDLEIDVANNIFSPEEAAIYIMKEAGVIG